MPSKTEKICTLWWIISQEVTCATTFAGTGDSAKMLQVSHNLRAFSVEAWVFRVLCGMSDTGVRVHPCKKHTPQRHQTWKFSYWRRWLSSHNGFWNCTHLEGRERTGHFWYPRLHGTWSHVSNQSHLSSRLLCCGGHGLRVHVWKGKSNLISKIICFTNFQIEALHWKIEEGN